MRILRVPVLATCFCSQTPVTQPRFATRASQDAQGLTTTTNNNNDDNNNATNNHENEK